jgi:hypothetical protein
MVWRSARAGRDTKTRQSQDAGRGRSAARVTAECFVAGAHVPSAAYAYDHPRLTA